MSFFLFFFILTMTIQQKQIDTPSWTALNEVQ
jgi:hypothetical protein